MYYRVASDDGPTIPSVNLAGVAVVTFDGSKAAFDGYTAELGTDLFQAPTLFSESALRGSLEASGRTFTGLEAGDIDGNASTDTGIAFNYIVANELFDDDPNTTWGGEIDWPGDEKALSESGVKLFNLHFTAKDEFAADREDTNQYLSVNNGAQLQRHKQQWFCGSGCSNSRSEQHLNQFRSRLRRRSCGRRVDHSQLHSLQKRRSDRCSNSQLEN